MTKISAFIHGVYPRTAELVQTSRDVDRKRASNTDLQKQRQRDYDGLQKLQKSAGFIYIEDGKFSWQDMFRPIVEATEGMEVGALTRWFNNNSFYRQPLITGKLNLQENKLDDFFPKPQSGLWKVSLPSPFTFAKVIGDSTDAPFEKTLVSITSLLSRVVAYLNKKGIEFVQVNEPYLPYYGASKSDLILLEDSLTSLKKILGEKPLALHTYFGNSLPIVTGLEKSKSIDVIGVDFFHTPLSSLPKKLPYDIIAGVVEGRNSLLENEATIKTFIAKAVKHLQPRTLYLCNNSDLDLLPESVARGKVKLLGDIQKSFQ